MMLMAMVDGAAAVIVEPALQMGVRIYRSIGR